MRSGQPGLVYERPLEPALIGQDAPEDLDGA